MLRRVRAALLWDSLVPGPSPPWSTRYPLLAPPRAPGPPRSARRPVLGQPLSRSGGPAAGGTWMCGDLLTRGVGLRAALRARFLHSPPSPTFAATLASLQLEVGHPCPAKTLLLGSSDASFHQPCGSYPLLLWAVCQGYGLTLTFFPWVGLGRGSTASCCVWEWLFVGRGDGNPSSLPCIHVRSFSRGCPKPFSLTTAPQTSGEAA